MTAGSLQQLDIDHGMDLTDEGLAALGHGLTALTHLRINNACAGPRGLSSIVPGRVRLCSISINQ